MSVGESNTPITALVRHYSRLVVYKTNSVYSCQYGIATLDDSSVAAAFYCTPSTGSWGMRLWGRSVLWRTTPFSVFQQYLRMEIHVFVRKSGFGRADGQADQ